MIESLVFASANPGKITEAKLLLDGIEVIPYESLLGRMEIEETGATFKDNARLKAETISARLARPVIADDSGLVIPALDGFPGIRTNRFMEESGGTEAAFAELAKRLEGKDTAAYFVCVVALVMPGQAVKFATGEVHGFLSFPPRGTGGFGYDSVFIPNGYGSTFAELGEEVKSQISHRAAAFRKLVSYLATLKPAVAEPAAETKKEELVAPKVKSKAPAKSRIRREVKAEEFEEAMHTAEVQKEND
ncbi:MAG: RdgB/HAM1 family non-canonical purine NTP pyrophosphatase [Rickettsiales bacterium]|jgi:XTP/dITP diphosphohydrolase|nr:RdgB/HAM1 family non-canonical purine NTP pyrophosphatase [Rickettsiales bacterium]